MSEVLTRSLVDQPLDHPRRALAADLRRRDPAGLRLRDAGRDRLRYLLVDLHRLAGADRLEGTRARLRPPARADRRARRARVPAFADEIDDGEARRRRRGRRRSRARRPAARARAARPPARWRRPSPRATIGDGAGAADPTASEAAADQAVGRAPRSATPNGANGASSAASTGGTDDEAADGTARLVHDGDRPLALHGLPARPLLAGHRRRLHRRGRSARWSSARSSWPPAGNSLGDTDIATALVAVPGTAIGLAVVWAIGVRTEQQPLTTPRASGRCNLRAAGRRPEASVWRRLAWVGGGDRSRHIAPSPTPTRGAGARRASSG